MSVQNCGWNTENTIVNGSYYMTLVGDQTVTGSKTVTVLPTTVQATNANSIITLKDLQKTTISINDFIVVITGDGIQQTIYSQVLPTLGSYIWTVRARVPLGVTELTIGSAGIVGSSNLTSQMVKYPNVPDNSGYYMTFQGLVNSPTDNYSCPFFMMAITLDGQSTSITLDEFNIYYQTFKVPY